MRVSTVPCADAGEGPNFDGGWTLTNFARFFTVNEASGSSILGANQKCCKILHLYGGVILILILGLF